MVNVAHRLVLASKMIITTHVTNDLKFEIVKHPQQLFLGEIQNVIQDSLDFSAHKVK